MLDFADHPYRFIPANRSPVLAWAAGWFNRARNLPRKERIASVDVAGHEGLGAGGGLLFVPNHPTHSDPAIVFEALRRAGIASLFMVAYDLFLRSASQAWIIRHVGGFSVDREGSDSESSRAAVETLRRGRFALTIFPEGNVYLQNDRVTPFHDGPAFFALRAVKEGARASVVPVSIKATHLTDARASRLERLARFAKDVGAEPGRDPLESLRRAGLAALRKNLRQRGIEAAAEAGTLPELIRRCAGDVLGRLESKMELPPRPDDPPIERVRRARREIHRIRTDPERAADHRAAALWADEAMLAFKVASYSGDYVESKPTLDRFSETVEKLEEDIYSRMPRPDADRHAFVRFGEPIECGPILERHPKLRGAVQELTETCERAVQAGLDAINEANPHPGAAAL